MVTKGISVQETSPGVIPDVAGRSVLDIGAWDGKFSFAAEKAGAARVVALDHYAWGVDFVARGAYWEECIRNGTLPDQSRDETDFWRPDLPGRRGFEFAEAALDSKVEPVVGDFQKVDLDELGQFDVVLYLGVLYHMKEPLTCLERLRSRHQRGGRHRDRGGPPPAPRRRGAAPIPCRQLAADRLRQLVRADHRGPAQPVPGRPGFARIETIVGPPPPPAATGHVLVQKVGPPGRGRGDAPGLSAPSQNYRAVVHAFTD